MNGNSLQGMFVYFYSAVCLHCLFTFTLLYVQGAAGVGKAVADWITNGRASGNFLPFELSRFTSLHNNPR